MSLILRCDYREPGHGGPVTRCAETLPAVRVVSLAALPAAVMAAITGSPWETRQLGAGEPVHVYCLAHRQNTVPQ